jgi:hypothetical protein
MLSSTTKILIGAGVAPAAGIGVAVAVSAPKSATPTTPPAPAPGLPPGAFSLHAGERYQLTITTPGYIPGVNLGLLQALLDRQYPGAFRVVSGALTGPGSNVSVWVVDVAGVGHVLTPGNFAFPGVEPSLMAVSIADLGPAPAPVGGVGPVVPPAAAMPPAYVPPPGMPPIVSPPPAPPVVPPVAPPAGPQATWVYQRKADIPARARVRVTIAQSNYTWAGAAVGQPGDRERFANFIAQPHTLFAQYGMPFVWGPQDALPTDWPADDPNATPSVTGWHFEFLSPFDTPLAYSTLLAAIGLPGADVWIFGPGMSPAAATRTSSVLWQPATGLVPGDHVRATLAATDLAAFATALAVPSPDNSCNTLFALVAQSSFLDVVGHGGILVWCGLDGLPPDWPTPDDPSANHFEFRFLAAQSMQVAALPIPFSVWIARGNGA